MVSGKRHMAACSFRNGAVETNQEEACHEKYLHTSNQLRGFLMKVLQMQPPPVQISFAGLEALGIPGLGTLWNSTNVVMKWLWSAQQAAGNLVFLLGFASAVQCLRHLLFVSVEIISQIKTNAKI